jgi:hypothetical protein
VTWPGKHGEKDYRASIGSIAPTLGEYALLLGGKLIAEDRYPIEGRHAYLAHLRRVAQASDMDEVLECADAAAYAVSARITGSGFTLCHKGGANDCRSLCRECWSAGFRLPDAVVRDTLAWWGIAGENAEALLRKIQSA